MSDQSTPPSDPTPDQPMSAKEANAKAKAAKAEAKALRPWYKRPLILIGIAAVVVIGLIVATSGGGGDDTATTDTETTETTDGDATAEDGEAADSEEAEGEEAEEAPADDAAAGVGDAVRDGNFEFVVEGVETGVTNVGGDFGEDAQGEFSIVTMSVTNIGDEPQLFTDSDQIGFNSQGQQLSADTTAGIYANEDGQGFLEEVNPGNAITVKVVFDLPAGETLTAIELHDSSFSGGVEVSLV